MLKRFLVAALVGMTAPLGRLGRFVGRLGLRLQLQRLVFEKFLEAIDTALAPVARLLVSAEGSARIVGAAVDVDLAGADATRNLDRVG